MKIINFSFRPVHSDEREYIHSWIAQDYIAKWVHGHGLKNLLNGLDKFIEYQISYPGLQRDILITQHWLGCDNHVVRHHIFTGLNSLKIQHSLKPCLRYKGNPSCEACNTATW